MASESQVPTVRQAPTAGQRPATVDSQRADDRADMTTAERRLLAAMPLHAITALARRSRAPGTVRYRDRQLPR